MRIYNYFQNVSKDISKNYNVENMHDGTSGMKLISEGAQGIN